MEPQSPPIVAINPIAEAGFPDVICPAIFVGGCNMRCDYCLNATVVKHSGKTVPVSDVIRYLRENEETQVLVTGGEPCAHSSLPNLLKTLVDEGFSARLSTNGTFFEMLYRVVEDGLVSFVAMDIKTDVLDSEAWEKLYSFEQVNSLKKSIAYLNVMAETPRADFNFEFRTTIYPPYVSKPNIISLSGIMHQNATWFLQQFRGREGLLGGDRAAGVKPYSEAELEELLRAVRQNVPKTYIRWP